MFLFLDVLTEMNCIVKKKEIELLPATQTFYLPPSLLPCRLVRFLLPLVLLEEILQGHFPSKGVREEHTCALSKSIPAVLYNCE